MTFTAEPDYLVRLADEPAEAEPFDSLLAALAEAVRLNHYHEGQRLVEVFQEEDLTEVAADGSRQVRFGSKVLYRLSAKGEDVLSPAVEVALDASQP